MGIIGLDKVIARLERIDDKLGVLLKMHKIEDADPQHLCDDCPFFKGKADGY